MYYVIYFGDDGPSIEIMDRAGVEKLIKDLTHDYPDGIPVLDQLTGTKRIYMNGFYPENQYMIIKGEQVIPKAVTTVTEYKI